jgi:NADPH-dependent F420 reductase
MKIAIIGTGNMGTGLAKGFVPKHEVVLGSRHPEHAREVAEEIGAAGGTGYEEAARDAEVVVIALPWTAVKETIELLGDLSGKILLDVTNPFGPQGLVELKGTSSSQEVQKLAKGARVVKAWNTVYARNLTKPDFDGVAASVFICGDDQEAKDVVFGLAREIGFDPVDVGPLASAASLTQLLLVLGALKTGPDTQLKLLRR